MQYNLYESYRVSSAKTAKYRPLSIFPDLDIFHCCRCRGICG